jgi:hypothetical protein
LAFTVSAQLPVNYESGLPGAKYYHAKSKAIEAFSPLSKVTVNFEPVIDYLQKSKNQKKAAFILLGSGVSLIIVSIIIPKGELVHEGVFLDPSGDDYKNDGIRTAFFITGAVATLASIPLFISSKKNQKRATSTSCILKLENSLAYGHNSLINYYPAIGLQISLLN